MKEFDDIFRENVEKAFGGYDADHLADKGWDSLMQKKNARRGLFIVLPLWTKAASLAILLGLGGYFIYSWLNRQPASETTVAASSPVKDESETSLPVVSTEKISTLPHGSKETHTGTQKSMSSVKPALEIYAVASDTATREITGDQAEPVLAQVADNRITEPSDTVTLPLEEEVRVPVEEILPEPEELKSGKRSGRTSIMAGFSGLLASSGESSSVAPGVSVGFYLDQKITRRISFRPGLALSRQSIGLENDGALPASAYSMQLSDGTSGQVDSYSGQLDMLAFEVPLNLVFRIYEKGRSGIYVSGGASSMIYLSQQMKAGFVNEYTKTSINAMSGEAMSETRYSTVEVENNYGAFSRVDMFRLVNLSAGYQFGSGKSGTMIIEPFVQLPVSDLTSLDLKVRYAGISLKMLFGKQQQDPK
ncbi:MAG: hypothetical protein MUE74_08455 [Bacteroidales bacterium]|nr:hypothetical protein [Bacteroidales bacterium]